MVAIIKLLFLAFTATATVLPRDAATVEADIAQRIGPQNQALNNAVNSFPASGLAGALAINSNILSLTSTVEGATDDVQSSGSFSEVDGVTILSEVQAIVPTLLDTLSVLEIQVPAWSDIPGGQALVLSDLQNLNGSFTGFNDALIAASPANLVPAGTFVKTQIADGFRRAIDAYSS